MVRECSGTINIEEPITLLFNVGDCYHWGYALRKVTRIELTGFAYPDNAIYHYSTWNGFNWDGPGSIGGTALVGIEKVSCIPACIPSWNCEQPFNGYENDGCGNRRYNSVCDPTLPTADGISTTDPVLANEQIREYYWARVPSCDRWAYIHSTIGQKVIDWGVIRWGWDAGSVENGLRSFISDNPCPPPPPIVPPPSPVTWDYVGWVCWHTNVDGVTVQITAWKTAEGIMTRRSDGGSDVISSDYGHMFTGVC